AIERAASRHDLSIPEETAFTARHGLGAQGQGDGDDVLIGSPEQMAEHGVAISAALHAEADRARAEGRSVVLLARSGQIVGALHLADRLRPHARRAVAALHAHGLRTVLLTGDSPQAARRVADELGITTIRAGVLPAQKADVIADLQREGQTVA